MTWSASLPGAQAKKLVLRPRWPCWNEAWEDKVWTGLTDKAVLIKDEFSFNFKGLQARGKKSQEIS